MTPITGRSSETSQREASKKRSDYFKNLIEELKRILIEKNLGVESDMTSQELVLIRIVAILRGIELVNDRDDGISSAMTGKNKTSAARQRMMYRRGRRDIALRHLEEFVVRQGNGYFPPLTQARILTAVRDHLLNIPTRPPQVPPPFVQLAAFAQVMLNNGLFRIPTPHGLFVPVPIGYGRFGNSIYGTYGRPRFPPFFGMVNTVRAQPALPLPAETSTISRNSVMMSNPVQEEQNEEDDEEIDIVGI